VFGPLMHAVKCLQAESVIYDHHHHHHILCLKKTDRTQLKTIQAITSKINNIGPIQLQTIGFFSKCLYAVLVLQSFYQVGVHGVQAVVCRVCVF